jgi:hypothetical protein
MYKIAKTINYLYITVISKFYLLSRLITMHIFLLNFLYLKDNALEIEVLLSLKLLKLKRSVLKYQNPTTGILKNKTWLQSIYFTVKLETN